jgi:hypothetical protein
VRCCVCRARGETWDVGCGIWDVPCPMSCDAGQRAMGRDVYPTWTRRVTDAFAFLQTCSGPTFGKLQSFAILIFRLAGRDLLPACHFLPRTPRLVQTTSRHSTHRHRRWASIRYYLLRRLGSNRCREQPTRNRPSPSATRSLSGERVSPCPAMPGRRCTRHTHNLSDKFGFPWDTSSTG